MNNWQRIKLSNKDYFILTMGQSPSSESYNLIGEGLPFFQGRKDFGAINPIPTTWCNNPIRVAEENDVLISVRAPVGSINIANMKCCIGRGLSSIRAVRERVSFEYLYYFILIQESYFNSISRGTTFSSIGKDDLENLEIPLPPLDEQKRIVEKIKKAFEKIEEVDMDISKSLNSINNIHRARQYIIFETEIDSGTAIVKLSDVVVFDKKTITPISNEKYYYLSLGDIQSNTGKVLNKNYVDGGSIKSTKLKFSKHNILYSKLRPYLNKVVLPDEDGICVTDLVPLKPNTDLIGKNYLWHYLRSYYVLDYVNSKMTGIKMPRLRTEDFNNLPVILPSKERQNEIVQLFSNNELEIELTKSVDNISKTISKLKQSILKKAFSGEL